MARSGSSFRILAIPLILLLGAFSTQLQAATENDFTLPDLKGQSHSLSDYRGQWVLVNYWATWCPPCLEELPELEVFHSNAEGRAVVLGVNMEDIEQTALSAFVEEQFLSFPILRAPARPHPDQLIGPVEGLPTSYLITPKGEIVARQVGAITASAIDRFIEDYESKQTGGEQ